MTTYQAVPAGGPGTKGAAHGRGRDLRDPVYQAFLLLRTVFTVAPIAFGLDKFANVLTDWPRYLSHTFDQVIPGNAHQAMLMVGEVAAGVLVPLRPHIGAWVVAAWLAGIILNLLLVPGFSDVALRDFGLLVGAVALARLAWALRPAPAGPSAP